MPGSDHLHRTQLVDVKDVIGTARNVDDRVREKVVTRPVPRVPPVNAMGKCVNALLELLLRCRMAETDPDVVVAPEGEDPAIQNVRGRMGRVLLGKESAGFELGE